jgi:hypothetical protein
MCCWVIFNINCSLWYGSCPQKSWITLNGCCKESNPFEVEAFTVSFSNFYVLAQSINRDFFSIFIDFSWIFTFYVVWYKIWVASDLDLPVHRISKVIEGISDNDNLLNPSWALYDKSKPCLTLTHISVKIIFNQERESCRVRRYAIFTLRTLSSVVLIWVLGDILICFPRVSPNLANEKFLATCLVNAKTFSNFSSTVV